MSAGVPAMAGPFEPSDFAALVPEDKKLSPEWIASLRAPGSPEVYSGDALEKIGMPVGGLCAGQVYLGGDGRLWHWDIFNQPVGTSAEHYAHPLHPTSPILQGFAVRIETDGQERTRPLDRTGFNNVSFKGEYPIGTVEYRDPEEPVHVTVTAYSPFIPLDTQNSSLPAIVMEFKVRNTGSAATEIHLAGWLENGAGRFSGVGEGNGNRQVVLRREAGLSFLEFSCHPVTVADARPPRVIADFEGEGYPGWTIEGEAFGSGPAHGSLAPEQRISGFEGHGLVNSYRGGDGPWGKLISSPFVIDRRYLSFLIGGGNHPGETCMNLLVDGKVVRTATGQNSDTLTWRSWDVQDLAGKTGHLEIVDRHSGGWGHIDIDQIELRDAPHLPGQRFEDLFDIGTQALGLVGGSHGVFHNLELDSEKFPYEAVTAAGRDRTEQALTPGRQIGALGRTFRLNPGNEETLIFLITWNFPNLHLEGVPGGRDYSTRFSSASEVARYLSREHSSLSQKTKRWRDTWYDSTLPRWFLDRTFANSSTLATSTSYRFPSGRFYGWEGVGCCAGTCTHVWHYAHAPARLFPELERTARSMADYGVSFDPASGLIDFRGEFHFGYAADGQAGCILRAYREHQMADDDSFLRPLWPRVKQSLQFLIVQDGNADGILEGAQPNTLDTAWYGPISWISSLYLAALRAGEEMAREMGDEAFAREAHAIFERGSRSIVERLWNGEYFIQRPDPAHPEAMRSGNGCEIDQVFGQSWAFQVGLGRILPQDKTRLALQSLWKYNFTPDVGPYREKYRIGRWYAMPGEAGLIMCTFPHGGREGFAGKVEDWAAGYFNECMTGFEYQAAGHMIWEGLVTEGLAITRAIHDRYHPSRRNPWNEVECGDHYARAMASYGVFLAACGFEHHGPKGHLGFAPRVQPERFRAAFTSAEGWGSYSQEQQPHEMTAGIKFHFGQLRLKTLTLEVPEGIRTRALHTEVQGQPVEATFSQQGRRIQIQFSRELRLSTGDGLTARLSCIPA